MSLKDKNKKLVPIPKMRMKTFWQNVQKTLMINCLKKYSYGKDFNSFINEFDHATNKEDS